MTRDIWSYKDQTRSFSLLKDVFLSNVCPCCPGVEMLNISNSSSISYARVVGAHRKVLCCNLCGWWLMTEDREGEGKEKGTA